MCGITGLVSQDNLDRIVPMTAALVHRGPDGEGFYRDECIALGHRRLSIIDLEGGKQPIADKTGNLILICNGEIYNSPELREKLIGLGYGFSTNTDVEVILPLYAEYGRDCVKHLRGMFAFAIWDKNNRTLFFARDHMGQKPLFFFHNGRELAFASEVKGILAGKLVTPQIDLEGLWHYMSLRYMPDQYTLFKGVRSLPAATWAEFRDGSLTLQQYWEPSFLTKQSGSIEQVTDGLDSLIAQSVNMHMLSDVPVGAFLSGGIDSSLVAALIAKSSSERIPSFSIGVKDHGFNELPFARMVAEKYNLDPHEKIVEADLVQMMPAMIHHMDEPADPFGVGVYMVSEVASEFVKVVQSGDGGDENFAGYDRFAGQRVVDQYCLLPRWFREKVMRAIINRIPESFGYKSIAQKARWVNEMSFFTSGERYAESLCFLRFTQDGKQQLFTEQAQQQIEDYDSIAKILAYFNADNVDDLVDRMLYTDLMTRMPGHLLALVDRMSMAHSLEIRPPLIDYKVVEFAASIPGAMKLKGRDLKHILKKVALRHLPKELVYREKQGFSFPIARWLRTDLRGFTTRLFKQSRLVELQIFNGGYMDAMLDEHLQGKVDHNYRLWMLINLEFWYRLFFEGESIESMQEFAASLSQP